MMSMKDVTVELGPVRVHLDLTNTRITRGVVFAVARLVVNLILLDMRKTMMKWSVKKNVKEIGGDGT